MNTIKYTKTMAALAAAALLCTGCSDKAAQTASTANQTDAAAQTDTTRSEEHTSELQSQR